MAKKKYATARKNIINEENDNEDETGEQRDKRQN